MTIRIDPEFKDYLGPLDAEAKQALEESLMAEGCRDALVVWPQADGDAILLDGHNRHAICEDLGIAYRVAECPVPIETREAAIAWIVQNQRARRNLTADKLRYLSAKLHLVSRSDRKGNLRHGDHSPKCQIDTSGKSDPTAVRVAREFGISPRTVLRNVKFAEQVDAIAAEHGLEAKQDILAGRKKVADFMPRPEPSARKDGAPPKPEADTPAITSAGVGPDFHGKSDSECVDWMAKNLRPNGPSGAVNKPIPMPASMSENLADPEVAARGDNPFIFALCQMEFHATRAELELKLHPPPSETRATLAKRLVDLSSALQTLSLALEETS